MARQNAVVSATNSPLTGMIGLEIHAYLVTREKLFCTCVASREKGLQSNIHICPICTGQPGAKPMLPNKNAVEKAVQIGLLLGCTINSQLVWQRKHYHWPDLPKGYQNTLSGDFAVPVGVRGKFQGISISSMHLEEDPASWTPTTGCVDYNRSGLPLVEIITAPEFSTAEEVVAWLGQLVHALAYLKAVDSNAGIKVDVNVSIPNVSERVEIKNINSLENIGLAIEAELKRQTLEKSRKRETRRFDEVTGTTVLMREKEGAADYRFLPDPDLQSLVLDEQMIQRLKKSLPELPEVKLEKLVRLHKIDEKNAVILAKHLDIAEFFENVAEKIDSHFALHWITGELLRLLNYHKKKLDEIEIKVEHFVALLKLVKAGTITELQGKQILNQFYPKSFMPASVAGKISDAEELASFIEKVIAANPKAVADFHAGEKKAFDFLMGEVMKATEKRADFKVARDVLGKRLKK